MPRKKQEIAECNKRIEYIDRIRKCYISWNGISVCELYHEYSTLSGEFDWAFHPLYDGIQKAKEMGYYIDIAGIDLDLHKEWYYRRYNCAFVTQRTPPEGRGDVPEVLSRIGIDEYDLFEIMCRTNARCGNDDYYVSRYKDKYVDVDLMFVDFVPELPDFDYKEEGWLDDYINKGN